MQHPKIAKKSPSGHHRTNLSRYSFATEARIDNRKKLVKRRYVLHMSSLYGELRPTNGWDLLASLGHPCKFQRVSRLGSVTARHLVVGVSRTVWRWTEGATYVTLGIGPHFYLFYVCVEIDITMKPQQQHTVVTAAGPVQPVLVSQPYQTTSVIDSYRHRQSTVIGALLIIAGSLSIIVSIMAIVFLKEDHAAVAAKVGGSGIVCGVMVSNPLCTVMYAVSQNKTSHYYHDHNFAKCWLIFKILSLTDLCKFVVNLQQDRHWLSHHTFSVSLHYLMK